MSRYKPYLAAMIVCLSLFLIAGCPEDDESTTQSKPGTLGVDWHLRTLSLSATGIDWDGTRFVAVTFDDTTLTSSDAARWTKHTNAIPGAFARPFYAGGKHLARFQSDWVAWADSSLTWTLSNYRGTWPVEDFAYGAGLLVIVSAGDGIHTSTDGSSWTWQVHTDYRIDVVCWDGDRFVATNGTVTLLSDDGITWTPHLVNGGGTYLTADCLACNDDRLVLIGNKRLDTATIMISTSSDGINWETDTLADYKHVNDLVWTGSQFLACGNRGQLLVSPDGLDWQLVPVVTSADLYQIAVSPNQWVIVGNDNTLLVSP